MFCKRCADGSRFFYIVQQRFVKLICTYNLHLLLLLFCKYDMTSRFKCIQTMSIGSSFFQKSSSAFRINYLLCILFLLTFNQNYTNMNNVDMSVFSGYCQSLDYHTRLSLRKELERETGYSHSGVWNWMNGTRNPKRPTQLIISKVVGIKVDELFPAN